MIFALLDHIFQKIKMSFVDHDKFEKACKVGDLETVEKLL